MLENNRSKQYPFLIANCAAQAENHVSFGAGKVLHQTANYVMRTEDLPCAIPGRTIVLLLKTMVRCTSSVRTLQTYQSGYCTHAQ